MNAPLSFHSPIAAKSRGGTRTVLAFVPPVASADVVLQRVAEEVGRAAFANGTDSFDVIPLGMSGSQVLIGVELLTASPQGDVRAIFEDKLKEDTTLGLQPKPKELTWSNG